MALECVLDRFGSAETYRIERDNVAGLGRVKSDQHIVWIGVDQVGCCVCLQTHSASERARVPRSQLQNLFKP